MRKKHWKGNIAIVFKETGFKDIYWIHLPSDRDQYWTVVKIVINKLTDKLRGYCSLKKDCN